MRTRSLSGEVPTVAGTACLGNSPPLDRLARAAGKPPGMLPVVDENPTAPSALPSADSYAFFTAWATKCNWKNEVTVKT